IQHHKGPKDAGEFIGMILSFLFERMEPVLADLNESIDLAEEGILEHADLTLRDKINQIRRNAIIFKRYLAPQREAVNQLRISDLDWLKDMHRRHFLEAYNNITRYVEDLDAIRERAQIVKDELSNLIANNLNSNMYVLSVIAAIFLPLGFLTGLLGVNIGGIPGGAYDYAFLIFCALLAVLVGLQIYLFRKFKWI
ncbi:MAG: CorA family divalent cation transporter, partial [Alphaproteobacteria bacterium]|nr:CorA family divalent cation transporter [Alphaproteobacteria bacterium]